MAPADRRQVIIERVTGEGLRRYVPDLARLRIQVFRDWPYLYEGDEAYERTYLETYIRSPRSVVVLALDGGRAVGASTALPLADIDNAKLVLTDELIAASLKQHD